ncbi:3-oxoacyl-ACP reductase family protein [Nocardia bovistercoris]|uniref:3-oxoacyl-[acyl-carrier-protein] reductase MabA n=1 Tax=Nocardia bovistercoris TaxID=2785916 RepID=A0A931I828_9NOCA|nr:3-oxoacyl-ACP reductase family protein [Nocardia bovistercoris]MBH0775472.1 3-oxoacyl-ACP reductase FabG [Nocardia bovistercoris]
MSSTRTALVTGGSGGIGQAICRRLASDGVFVAVNYYRGEQAAKEVVAEIEHNGGTAIAVQGDVSLPEDAERVVRETVEAAGRLDILVNNSGITRNRLIMQMEHDDWLDVMRVNFGGVFNCTKAASSVLAQQDSAAIVNVSSVMGQRAWLGCANYAASKAAINSFTKASAVEFARFGIKVNAVLPGFVETEMIADVLSGGNGDGVIGQLPVPSATTADEVAEVVAFLAAPDTPHMTGALLPIDGAGGVTLLLGKPLKKSRR